MRLNKASNKFVVNTVLIVSIFSIYCLPGSDHLALTTERPSEGVQVPRGLVRD